MNDPVVIAIVFTLLGWLLGILQPAITEAIRRRRETHEVIPALQIELDELRYRVALATYMLQLRFGTVDKSFLQWVRAKIEQYQGANPRDGLLQAVVGQLALSDEQLANVVANQRAKPDGGLSVKKYAAPLVDSRISLFWQLRPLLQRALLEVRSNLDLFNDDVARAQGYLDLTFSDLSNDNYARVQLNLDRCYRNVADRGRILADKIDAALLESCK